MPQATRAGWYSNGPHTAFHYTENGTRPLCGSTNPSGYPRPDALILAAPVPGFHVCGHCKRYTDARAAKAVVQPVAKETAPPAPNQLALFDEKA